MHVVTLTPSDRSTNDDVEGCFVLDPLDWLAKSGVRNTVLVVRSVHHRKARTYGSVVPLERIRYFSLPGRLWLPISGAFLFARIVSQLRELHRTQHIDLLHAHGLLPCGHAAMLLAKELGIPYIVSVYALDNLSTIQPLGRVERWCLRMARRVCAESRRVVCNNEHIREQLLKTTGRICRTSVVYNGVDPELFSPTSEPSGAAITVLSGGNMTASAGHDLLIRAIAVLFKEFPSLSLEIVGDGPERSRLQTLVMKENLVGVVHFRGRQPRREVAAAMKRCTLFALPSRSDALECTYLEAMSCGKAVIGCRGQGIAEIIQHGTNGFLVGTENEKELTIAMGILLREPQRRRNLGAAARDTVLERLTVEQQAQNLSRIYREVVASGTNSPPTRHTPLGSGS